MRISGFIAATLLSVLTTHTQADTATTSTRIDFSTLTITGPDFSFTPGGSGFDTSAVATAPDGIKFSEASNNDGSTAVFPGASAIANFDGTLLTAETQADFGTSLSSGRHFQVFLLEYLTDFGGSVDVTVDFEINVDDPIMANPVAPVPDVFGTAQLDIWTFADGFLSTSNDGDNAVLFTVFGAGAQSTMGTLATHIVMPDFPQGTALFFVAQTAVESTAAGAVPVPPALVLFLSSLAGLGMFRGRASAIT